jgi:prevent-host-death family protein
MKQVDASTLQAGLDELLDRVEHGETVVITRRGTPVARLMPERPHAIEQVEEAIAGIRALHAGMPRLSAEEIAAWRDEGRT